MRYVLTLAWGAALVQVALLFCVGQLLVSDSVVVRFVANLEPMLRALVGGLALWLEQHPEISVRTSQNVMFYNFSTLLMTLGLIAITLTIPHLITRDLSSNAILVYASKAVNRVDYLIGKLGVILGVLTLTWLGPLVAAWTLGNLLAPDWHFFWHARVPLFNTLLFVGGGMVVLGLIGLAASALSAKEKAAVGIWLLLWLAGNAFIPIGEANAPWLKHLSFSYNIRELAAAKFQPKADLERARDNVPGLGDVIRRTSHRRLQDWAPPATSGALLALGAMGTASVLLLLYRTRTE
jgi:hypothetical protein